MPTATTIIHHQRSAARSQCRSSCPVIMGCSLLSAHSGRGVPGLDDPALVQQGATRERRNSLFLTQPLDRGSEVGGDMVGRVLARLRQGWLLDAAAGTNHDAAAISP